jgi:hypothetical protein
MKPSHEKRNRVSRAYEHGTVRVGSDFSSDYLPAGEEVVNQHPRRRMTLKEKKWRKKHGLFDTLPKEKIVFENENRSRVALYNKIKRISQRPSDKHVYALVQGVAVKNLPTVNRILASTRKRDLKNQFNCLGLDTDSVEKLIVNYIEQLCRCKEPYEIEWQ